MNPLAERVLVGPVDSPFQIETGVESLNSLSPWI